SPRRDRAISSMKLGTVLGEDHAVRVGLDAGRLVSGRPNGSALDVSQEEVRAPAVPGDILAPPGDSKRAPTAVAGTGCRQHHRVATVGEQVSSGPRAV